MAMEMKFDPAAGSFYLKLSDREVVRTEDVDGKRRVLVDLDRDNGVVGIELIQPNRVSLQTVTRKFDLPPIRLDQVKFSSARIPKHVLEKAFA